jgi:hypothetical protein
LTQRWRLLGAWPSSLEKPEGQHGQQHHQTEPEEVEGGAVAEGALDSGEERGDDPTHALTCAKASELGEGICPAQAALRLQAISTRCERRDCKRTSPEPEGVRCSPTARAEMRRGSNQPAYGQ